MDPGGLSPAEPYPTHSVDGSGRQRAVHPKCVQSIESETWRSGTRILRTERRNLMEQFDAQGRANFFFTPRLKNSLMYSLFGANRHQAGRWIRPDMADEKFRQRNLDRLQRGDAIAIWEVADHHRLEAQFQVFEYHTRNYIPGHISASSTLLSYHGQMGYEFDSLRLFWLTHDVEVGGSYVYWQNRL